MTDKLIERAKEVIADADGDEEKMAFARLCIAQAEQLKAAYALEMTAQWVRNSLERIADGSWWQFDGRDFKRSLIGVFADFDEALAAYHTAKGKAHD